MIKLDKDSIKTLAQRRSRGRTLIGSAWGQEWKDMHPEDRESALKDGISDMLTAFLGEAGYCSPDGDQQWNELALNEARRLVEEALRSYEGDAEDYTREATS